MSKTNNPMSKLVKWYKKGEYDLDNNNGQVAFAVFSVLGLVFGSAIILYYLGVFNT